jgi:hypothetical protein
MLFKVGIREKFPNFNQMLLYSQLESGHTNLIVWRAGEHRAGNFFLVGAEGKK